MSDGILRRTLPVLIGAMGLLSLAVYGCSGGDTDGSGNSDAGAGDQYVADGGAGSTLTITVEDDSFGVGDKVNFFVDAKDPRGEPLAFIRIFCESEKGIAIVEPSSGGVAFEHTGPDGTMSGVLGGLLPGSFMLECRAPEGFNLISRVRLRVTGEVPAGFAGFPGAAGGNLGGGVVIDQPDSGVYIASITFTDASATTAGDPIDTTRTCCVNGGPSSTTTACTTLASSSGQPTGEWEDFADFVNYHITVANGTLEAVVVESIQITVSASGEVVLPEFNTVTPVPSGSAGVQISGVFIDHPHFSGTSTVVAAGTYPVEVTVSGRTARGDSFSITETVTITLADTKNC